MAMNLVYISICACCLNMFSYGDEDLEAIDFEILSQRMHDMHRTVEKNRVELSKRMKTLEDKVENLVKSEREKNSQDGKSEHAGEEMKINRDEYFIREKTLFRKMIMDEKQQLRRFQLIAENQLKERFEQERLNLVANLTLLLKHKQIDINDLQERRSITDCGPLNNPVNGIVQVGMSVAKYACNEYFIMEGSATRTCTKEGWSGPLPTCTRDCGPLTNPSKGRLSTSGGTSVGAFATYTCDTNIHLTSFVARTCETAGWSGSAPTCIASDFLLFVDSIHKQLYRMDVKTAVHSSIPVSQISNPVAVSYDSVDDVVYYTDNDLKQIRGVRFNGSNDILVLAMNSMAVLDGIAVDSTAHMLFFSDTGNDIIAVIYLREGRHSVVINSGLLEPRAIALDVVKRTLYWTDWGVLPKIEMANYDGSGRKTLINSGLLWPNGLAINAAEGILYWADAGTHLLERSNLDGTKRSIVAVASQIPPELKLEVLPNGTLHIKQETKKDHFFGLSFHNSGLLYYTDWNMKSVMKLDPNTGTKSPIGPAAFGRLNGIYAHSDAKIHSGCREGWTRFQMSCYLFNSALRSFKDAVKYCEERGSRIAFIETPAEDEFFKNWLSNPTVTRHIFVGLTDTLVEGKWKWHNMNSTAQYVNWAPGKPNGGRTQNCAALYPLGHSGWHDTACEVSQWSVCEQQIV